jgi:predicted lactoylglutathione lyase
LAGSRSGSAAGTRKAGGSEHARAHKPLLRPLGDFARGALLAFDAMAAKLFVNLPVKDLQRSIDFFTELGFDFDPQFTDDKATCVVIGEDSFVMLLVEERFKDFTKKEVCDATTHTELILALSADSREGVDQLVNKALEAGGQPSNEPMDMDGMHGWSFQDLDGHLWEVIWMDTSAQQQ